MKFEVRRRGVEVNEELRARIEEGLSAALGRLAGRVGRARAYLGGASGARKKCRVVVDLPRGGRVVVSGADARVLPLIKQTASRARSAVRRRLKRRLARHRRPRFARGPETR
jgi:ribosome-associated translation inhibitor RaiA